MKEVATKNKKSLIVKQKISDVIAQGSNLPIIRKQLSSWVILSIFTVLSASFFWLGKRTSNLEDQISSNNSHFLNMKGEIIVEINKQIEDQKYLNSNTRLIKSSERSIKKYFDQQLEERDKRIEKLISEIKVYRLQRSPASKSSSKVIPYTKVNYRTLRYQQKLERSKKEKEYKMIENNFVNNYPHDIAGFEDLRSIHKIALYKLNAQHSEKLLQFRNNRYTSSN